MNIPKTNPPLPLLVATGLFALLFFRLAYQRFSYTDDITPGGTETLFLLVTLGLTAACYFYWKQG